MDHFIKTGSGQTYGKLRKRVFSQGAHGPLSSLRLEAYRRGLEDRALLALLGAEEVLVDGTHGEEGGHGEPVGARQPVRQHQGLHALGALVALPTRSGAVVRERAAGAAGAPARFEKEAPEEGNTLPASFSVGGTRPISRNPALV